MNYGHYDFRKPFVRCPFERRSYIRKNIFSRNRKLLDNIIPGTNMISSITIEQKAITFHYEYDKNDDEKNMRKRRN